MKLQVWSDFSCPFCYIGHAHLDEALRQYPKKDQVELEFCSYQVDRRAKYDPNQSFKQYMIKAKPHLREEAVLDMLRQLEETAQEYDIPFDMDTIKVANTLHAHRVYHEAKLQGLGEKCFTRFQHAFFGEGAILSDLDTICKLATEVGLSEEKVRQIWDDTNFHSEAIKKEIDKLDRVGAQGVPFFIFEDKFSLAGTQAPDKLLKYFDVVAKKVALREKIQAKLKK